MALAEPGPDLYVAVYLAPLPCERHRPDQPAETAIAFDTAVRSAAFPYDIGDDPAFFSAAYHDGPVTWGVCRPDVRVMIRPGDWVAFLSCQHHPADAGTRVYRFVVCLRVEAKLSQAALFAPSTNYPYRDYLNLLVRPNGAGWEHHEPGLNEEEWHRDWLWRICDPRSLRNGRAVRKEDIVESGRTHVRGSQFSINGCPLPLADNYVVFSKESALIAQDPPVVAVYRIGDRGETWGRDERSTRIRAVLFGKSGRGLRTGNRQQPHRHFRRRLDDRSWPATLMDALRGTKFQTQAPIDPLPRTGALSPADSKATGGSKRHPIRGPKCGC